MALFVSMASAALPVASTQTCTITAAAAPSIRTEGIAEQVGDLVITCTGGPAPVANGNDIGFVNITVDYGVPVTSVVIGGFGVEAQVTLDEPLQTGGYTAIRACALGAAAPAAATVGLAPSNAPCTIGAGAVAGVIDDVTASNVFQGYIVSTNANAVEFDNVPIQALAANTQHILRVTNVRVTPGGSPVVATVTFKAVGASLVGLTAATATATVATPATGLVPSVTGTGITVCGSTNLAGTTASPNYAILTFKEGFATAFKPIDASIYAAAAANTGVTGSKKVGSVTFNKYQTESGFTGGVAGAGAATSPTRVKATFTGLDKNIAYYISLNNVDAYNVAGATVRANLLKQSPGAGIAMETQATGAANYEPVVAGQNANGTVPVAKLTVSSTGTAQAVWEITTPDQASVDALQFAVYAVFSTASSPTPSTSPTVQLGFAPTTAATAPNATWIPRFLAPAAAGAFAPILKCQTSLLFPFITNQSGFETGIAIANTSADPFQTQATNGTCAVQFYGTNAPAAAVVFGPAAGVNAGTVSAATASSLGLVNFQGYGIATCNFQFAHGFAFVQGNAGASNSTAMGYLPVVLAGTNRGQALQGENLGQ